MRGTGQTKNCSTNVRQDVSRVRIRFRREKFGDWRRAGAAGAVMVLLVGYLGSQVVRPQTFASSARVVTLPYVLTSTDGSESSGSSAQNSNKDNKSQNKNDGAGASSVQHTGRSDGTSDSKDGTSANSVGGGINSGPGTATSSPNAGVTQNHAGGIATGNTTAGASSDAKNSGEGAEVAVSTVRASGGANTVARAGASLSQEVPGATKPAPVAESETAVVALPPTNEPAGSARVTRKPDAHESASGSTATKAGSDKPGSVTESKTLTAPLSSIGEPTIAGKPTTAVSPNAVSADTPQKTAAITHAFRDALTKVASESTPARPDSATNTAVQPAGVAVSSKSAATQVTEMLAKALKSPEVAQVAQPAPPAQVTPTPRTKPSNLFFDSGLWALGGLGLVNLDSIIKGAGTNIARDLGAPSDVAEVFGKMASDAGLKWLDGKIASDDINKFLTNPSVGKFVGDSATQLAKSQGLNPELSAALGSALGNAVKKFFGEPNARADLSQLIDNFVVESDIPQTLKSSWFSIVAYYVPIVNLVTGKSVSDVIKTQLGSQAGSDALKKLVNSVLNNPAIQSSLGGATTQFVTELAQDPAVRHEVVNALQQWVSKYLGSALGNSALGTTAGKEIANGINDVLTDPSLGTSLGDMVGKTIVNLLQNPKLSTALKTITDETITAILGGAKPQDALNLALKKLQDNPEVAQALGGTLGESLKSILSNPAVQQGAGAGVSKVVNNLLENAEVRQQLIQTLKEQVQHDLGEAPFAKIAGHGLLAGLDSLLSDPAFASKLGPALGDALNNLLKDPKLIDELSATMRHASTAILGGANIQDTLNAAVKTLLANPSVHAALGSTVSSALNSVLGSPEAPPAIGKAASLALVGVLKDPGIKDAVAKTVTSVLGDNPVGNFIGQALGFLAHLALSNPITTWIAGQVTNVMVTQLLRNSAVRTGFSKIAGQVTTDIVAGKSPGQIAVDALSSLFGDKGLVSGAGMALGQGIGSLFGNNLIGNFIGYALGMIASFNFNIVACIGQLILTQFRSPVGAKVGNTVDKGTQIVGGGLLPIPLEMPNDEKKLGSLIGSAVAKWEPVALDAKKAA